MASDARSILGVNSKKSSSNPLDAAIGKTKAGVSGRLKKPPLGVSREVFALIQQQGGGEDDVSLAGGDSRGPSPIPASLPMMAPARTSSKKIGKLSKETKVAPWVWAPFSSSARSDGAEFKHWVKAGVEYPDYPFARFNIHLDSVEYTEDEYNLYLSNSEWTRSDTDKLMGLCRRLDLRWAVIHDQFNATPIRSIEQLQHRYYSVSSRLTHVRLTLAQAGPIDPSNPINTLGTGSSSQSFNLAYEEERRRQLEVAWSRSKEEEKEEADLRKELKLVEAQLRKLKKAGKGGDMTSSGVTATNPEETANSLFHRPLPAAGLPYLQSARLENPIGVNGLSKTLIKKMELVLNELEIEPRPLPTKTVVDMYDHLRKSIVTLLTLQKVASKKETLLLTKKHEINRAGGASGLEDGAPVVYHPHAHGVSAGQKRKAEAAPQNAGQMKRRG